MGCRVNDQKIRKPLKNMVPGDRIVPAGVPGPTRGFSIPISKFNYLIFQCVTRSVFTSVFTFWSKSTPNPTVSAVKSEYYNFYIRK